MTVTDGRSAVCPAGRTRTEACNESLGKVRSGRRTRRPQGRRRNGSTCKHTARADRCGRLSPPASGSDIAPPRPLLISGTAAGGEGSADSTDTTTANSRARVGRGRADPHHAQGVQRAGGLPPWAWAASARWPAACQGASIARPIRHSLLCCLYRRNRGPRVLTVAASLPACSAQRRRTGIRQDDVRSV